MVVVWRLVDHSGESMRRGCDFLHGWEETVLLLLFVGLWWRFRLLFFEWTRRQRNQLHLIVVGSGFCIVGLPRRVYSLPKSKVEAIDSRFAHGRCCATTWEVRTLCRRRIMDVVVQDPKRHLRLPTRHARRRRASRLGRHRRRLSRRVGRAYLSPSRPIPSIGRRASEIDYLRVAKRLDTTAVDILILAVRHQPHTALRLRQSQVQRCRSPCNNTSPQRPRDPDLLVARYLRQRRQPCRDLRGSLRRRPIGIAAPESLRSSSSHPFSNPLYKVSRRVDPGQETAFSCSNNKRGSETRPPSCLGSIQHCWGWPSLSRKPLVG
jgi:hypothetical protein